MLLWVKERMGVVGRVWVMWIVIGFIMFISSWLRMW